MLCDSPSCVQKSVYDKDKRLAQLGHECCGSGSNHAEEGDEDQDSELSGAEMHVNGTPKQHRKLAANKFKDQQNM